MGFVTLDLIEQLGSFGPSVVNKRINVLLEAVHRVFHVCVKYVGLLNTRLHVSKCVIDLFVFRNYRVALFCQRFVFGLL